MRYLFEQILLFVGDCFHVAAEMIRESRKSTHDLDSWMVVQGMKEKK